ncbi:putative LRR receptor-like serine/threonine-protein kinase, partial [Mucuna pruriens]
MNYFLHHFIFVHDSQQFLRFDPLLPLAAVNSLHINCGGDELTVGTKTYEADWDNAGPAMYKKGGSNWAFSNTGHFMDNSTSLLYTTKNATRLYMTNTELYKNARISPISLTYYGFCLENGKYKLKLHFAEIMFTDDNKFSSLGRRVFDVYIQFCGPNVGYAAKTCTQVDMIHH